MNKALKPGGARILNLSQTIYTSIVMLSGFLLQNNAFSICSDGHFKISSGLANAQPFGLNHNLNKRRTENFQA